MVISLESRLRLAKVWEKVQAELHGAFPKVTQEALDALTLEALEGFANDFTSISRSIRNEKNEPSQAKDREGGESESTGEVQSNQD